MATVGVWRSETNLIVTNRVRPCAIASDGDRDLFRAA